MNDRRIDVGPHQIECVSTHQIKYPTIGQTEHRQARRKERYIVILVHDLQALPGYYPQTNRQRTTVLEV